MSEHDSDMPGVTRVGKGSSLSGWGVFLRTLLFGFPVMIVVVVLMSVFDDETETIIMRGEVTLSADSAQRVSCENVSRLRIVTQGEEQVDATLILRRASVSGRGLPVPLHG